LVIQSNDDTNDIVFKTGSTPTTKWTLDNNGHILPSTDETYNIGSSSLHANIVYTRDVHSTSGSLDLRASGSSGMSFYTGDPTSTKKWEISSGGHLYPATNDSYDIGSSSLRLSKFYSVDGDVEQTHNNSLCLYLKNTSSTFQNHMVRMVATRSASSAYQFITLYSNSQSDLEFYLRGDGNAACDGSWSGGGADYAEYMESDDSTLNIGDSVVLSNDGTSKMRKFDALSDDTSDIIGVIRPKIGGSSVIGNIPLKWHNKYLRDVYGAYILDENGDRQLNPDYDDTLEYLTREERDEWYVVGLVGIVTINSGQGTHPSWKKIKDIDDTHESWLIK